MQKAFQDVKKRRQVLVIISGGLILLSLAAGRLAGGPCWQIC